MGIKNMMLSVFFFTILPAATLYAQPAAFSAYDVSGPYTNKTISNTGPDDAYDVFRPATLGENGEKHAIITWGNGTGARLSTYAPLLRHLATHGFVVIGSHSTSTGSGNEMADGVLWLMEENERNGSDYYGKLNTRNAGATGHSQGGAGTIQSLNHTDKITSIAPLAPATFTSPFFYSTAHVKALMFLMVGADDDLATPGSVRRASWESFGENAIGLYGELEGATHFEEVGDCGNFRKYVTAWFDATLNENPEAIAMLFDTANGALHATPTEWSTLLHQNLDSYESGKTAVSKGTMKDISISAKVENEFFFLRVPKGKQCNVRVYTIQGVLVYAAPFLQSYSIPLRAIGATGEYITTVHDGGRMVMTRKIVVTH